MGWREDLAAIRHQAALNCGLAEYPYELVTAHERVDLRGWDKIPPESRKARLARLYSARAALGLPPVDIPGRLR